MKTTQEILKNAKMAAAGLRILDSARKNEGLLAMADALETHASEILRANESDMAQAKDTLSVVMLDRLRLTEKRISDMAQGIRDVAALPDPVGEILDETRLPNGLLLRKVRVPIGVIGIIYESRPNVTSDACALCLKSGNVCVLRGGRDAFNTSFTIVSVMKKAWEACGLDPEAIQMIEDVSRESVKEMMSAVSYIDALIPRGGAGLIRACVENAKVPCIQTGTGICHIYVDQAADLEKALRIIENAKTSRPSVCNAEEVCLVHRAVAERFLPMLKKRLCDDRILRGERGVELRCDEPSYALIGGARARETDFDTEFLDYILAIKVVQNVDEAVAHIGTHSTGHSDGIVSEDADVCEQFVRCVDSAVVYVNASTRFTDGGEFGKGCEIGISTQKLHARGPMGLEELTSYKYIVKGQGQVRE